MTYLEEFKQKNPGKSTETIIDEECPMWTFHVEKPDYCGKCEDDCARCWTREIPNAEPTIKDSGTRQEFPTGAVRDIQKGKGRCDLLPLDVAAEFIGMADDPDHVLMGIATYMGTGQTEHLYYVLEMFRNMCGNEKETMLLEVSMHFEEGAEKYGEGNWQKGLPVKCYVNSAVRHYLKHLRGDTDERHDRAFCWNILCAIWTCTHKPELNEYPKKVCPVCNSTVPKGENECPHCRVYQSFDPDGFLGEYEEENE